MKSLKLISHSEEDEVARRIMSNGDKFSRQVSKGVRDADARVKRYVEKIPRASYKAVRF